MKTGIMFEDNDELNKKLCINFIAETWCNYPPSFEDLPVREQEELEAQGVDAYGYDNRELTLDMLPLRAQRDLKARGFTAEQFDDCKYLIRRAKRWAFETGLPHNYVMDTKELGHWGWLLAFTQIVAYT